MQDHEERVVTEAKELSFKMTKLNDFLDKQYFTPAPGMTEEASCLLIEQYMCMTAYLGVLRKRIKTFQRG